MVMNKWFDGCTYSNGNVPTIFMQLYLYSARTYAIKRKTRIYKCKINKNDKQNKKIFEKHELNID